MVSNIIINNIFIFKTIGTNVVEFVDPPASSNPGDRIIGEGLNGAVLTTNKCDKMKAFDIIAADLKVDSEGTPRWKDFKLVVASTGETCTVPTLTDSPIH